MTEFEGSSSPLLRVAFAVKKHARKLLLDLNPLYFLKTTAHEHCCRYITDLYNKAFQPMNVNFGIFPQPEYRIKEQKEEQFYAESGLKDFEKIYS